MWFWREGGLTGNVTGGTFRQVHQRAIIRALPSHRSLMRTAIWHCSAASYAMTATVFHFMAGGI